MVDSTLYPAAETDAGYGQIFGILIRRRFWFLGVFCLTLAIAGVQAFKAKPIYKSSLQMLVESNYQGKKQDGQAGADKQYADSNVEIDSATQLNLMQSSQILQKVVDLLRPEYPDLKVKDIKKSLSVTQVEDGKGESKTKIFQATYSDNDATKTQKVLQAMQRVYLDYNREQQKLRLAKGLAFIDNQLPNVRDSLTQSETALKQFRTKHNLIEPEAPAKALTDAINNIKQERRANEAQYRELQGRYNVLQQTIDRSPKTALVSSRLTQSARYQTLLNEIQKTDLALAQQRQRFTDDNPTVQKLILQRQEQLALLQEQGQRTLGGDSAQLNASQEGLLAQGQFGDTDLKLVNQLVEIETNLNGLKAREQTLLQKEQQLNIELEKFPSLLAEYNRLQPDILRLRETHQRLEKARQDLSSEITRGGFDWQVVEKPEIGESSGPKKQQILLVGAVAGLMLGGIAAFIREMTDDSVRTSDELKKQVSLPLLGMTPELPKNKKNEPTIHLPFSKPQALKAASSDPIIKLPFGKPQVLSPWTIEVIHWPPSWESLDLISKNIQLLNAVSTFRSLMITSALAGEGKTTLSLGLAVSAARLHQRVLLIDADLRNPTLHKRLNLPNDYGLSTLLASDTIIPIQSSIHSSSSYIDILTSGPIPSDPANLLSSPRMKELITEFEQSYDIVLLDTAPVLGMVDAIITGSFCNAVLLVARIGKVTKTELTQATAMLSKLNMIGVVANGGSNSSNTYAPKTMPV
ncbi:MAG: polysaccharide biosynthesis tyrosine autokinase [Potamolinea sp.]